MTDRKRGYYCDYCGLELQWFQVTHDERCVKCGNRVGGEYAGSDHAKVIALETQAVLDARVVGAAVEWFAAYRWVESVGGEYGDILNTPVADRERLGLSLEDAHHAMEVANEREDNARERLLAAVSTLLEEATG